MTVYSWMPDETVAQQRFVCAQTMGDLGGEFTPDWHDKQENPRMKSRGFQMGAAAASGPSSALGYAVSSTLQHVATANHQKTNADVKKKDNIRIAKCFSTSYIINLQSTSCVAAWTSVTVHIACMKSASSWSPSIGSCPLRLQAKIDRKGQMLWFRLSCLLLEIIV